MNRLSAFVKTTCNIASPENRLVWSHLSFKLRPDQAVFSHHDPVDIHSLFIISRPRQKKRAMQEIYHVLKLGGRFVLADFGPPQGVLLKTLFRLSALLPSREMKYLQDNREGKLPVFLEEAGFTSPRYQKIKASDLRSPVR